MISAMNDTIEQARDSGVSRAAVDAHEGGSFRATVARLLAALGAKVEFDATV